MKRSLAILSLAGLVASCMVGPDYEPPITPMPDRYYEDANAQTVDPDDSYLVEWWNIFEDPLLSSLMQESLYGSFDLSFAIEKICQAKAQYWVQFASIFPELTSDATFTRSRTSQSLARSALFGAPIQDFYQVGVDAIWEIDLFGKYRRGARSAHELWEAAADDARNVKIMVLSEVASTYVNIRAYQAKIDTNLRTIELQKEILDIVQDQFQAGITDEAALKNSEAILEESYASLAFNENLAQQSIYNLAILLGVLPESLPCRFTVHTQIPFSYGLIPTGLPSDLLRRRPDIQAAERRLASATEQIGVAYAQMFPSVSLTGSSSSFAANPLQGANFGYASNSLSKLFNPASRAWGIGSLISWPIFDFGKRQAGVDVQVSLQSQAYITYQKTVVTALKEVESALTAYFHEQERLASLHKEVDAYKMALDLTLDRYQGGLIDFSAVIQSELLWINAKNAYIDSQQALATDLVSIYKALGGEWECYCSP